MKRLSKPEWLGDEVTGDVRVLQLDADEEIRSKAGK